jgi:hypothetical protein
MLLEIVRLAMAVFVILGALCTISMIVFFLNVSVWAYILFAEELFF